MTIFNCRLLNVMLCGTPCMLGRIIQAFKLTDYFLFTKKLTAQCTLLMHIANIANIVQTSINFKVKESTNNI